ncbi:MAG: hypothetical protein JNM27_15690 [Leptospirales bacterium]|nr:hypothetical protein [Leptospirales bacterium]
MLRSALLRALPISVRIRSALEEQGFICRFDYDLPAWSGYSSEFFFDDGSPLRSCYVLKPSASPETIHEKFKSGRLFSARELASIHTQDSAFAEGVSATAVVYWPAEKTPLEKWISGRTSIKITELLPAREPTQVEQLSASVEVAPSQETAKTPEPILQSESAAQETDLPELEPEAWKYTQWNAFRYGVAGNLRGTVYRKSFLLHRAQNLCFAMMSGERALVQERHAAFIDFLKQVEDWPAGHRKYLEDYELPADTVTFMLGKDGHCRFYCRGIQPVYWSGRLKKLMRFPNTESPLNSRLHAGDYMLMIPGAFTAREVAEMREAFFYGEESRLASILDYGERGRGVLVAVDKESGL